MDLALRLKSDPAWLTTKDAEELTLSWELESISWLLGVLNACV